MTEFQSLAHTKTKVDGPGVLARCLDERMKGAPEPVVGGKVVLFPKKKKVGGAVWGFVGAAGEVVRSNPGALCSDAGG